MSSKFHETGKKVLDLLARVDYSELSKLKAEIAQMYGSIPKEELAKTVLTRLEEFYQVTNDHLAKYEHGDLGLIDALAVKGRQDKGAIEALLSQYQIKRKQGAKGHPEPYSAKQPMKYDAKRHEPLEFPREEEANEAYHRTGTDG